MWVNFERTFQGKLLKAPNSKFLKTYFWQYSNQILFEKQNHTSILMISTFKNVVTVIDKNLQRKKKSEFFNWEWVFKKLLNFRKPTWYETTECPRSKPNKRIGNALI